MGISAGVEGEAPVFTVQHNLTTWTGHTPTAPWTEACIKSKSSSTRVSGPLVRISKLLLTSNVVTVSYSFTASLILLQ